MSRCECAAGCGADVSQISGAFCTACRESLGLPPLPEPVKRHWSEKERQGFRDRAQRAQELQERIAALPEPDIDDPFVGPHGDLSIGLANGGGKR